MDPDNIPFNALIVGPTNSGKTQFLVNQLRGPFNGKFDYIVLMCPTFAYNRTLYRFGERDPRLYVIICEQHQVEIWLKAASFVFEGTNTLFYTPSAKTTKAIFEEYAGELSHDELKQMISRLKERKFAHLIFGLRFPFSIEEKQH